MRLALSPLGRVKTARGGGKDEQKTNAAVGCRFRVRMFPERASVENAVLAPPLFFVFLLGVKRKLEPGTRVAGTRSRSTPTAVFPLPSHHAVMSELYSEPHVPVSCVHCLWG